MSRGKGREYEVKFSLGGELDKSLKQALGMTEKEFNDVQKEMRKLSAADPFKEIRQDANKATRSVKEFDDSIGGMKNALRNVAEYAGAFALIDKGLEAVTGSFAAIGEYNSSMSQIQAATGLTAKDMQLIEGSVKELHKAGLGESFTDLSDAVATTRQITQLQGQELENLTQKALIYKDVFAEDVNESVRSADVLMRQFGITADQAYNLMAQGSQRGLNKTGELLDTINEFSPQFKVLGFTAEEMFDFFATGLDAGAWNLDKVGDLVKEFDNRIKDAGDAAAQDALAQLFAPPDIDDFAKALMTGSKATKEYQEIVARTDKDTAATLVKNLQAGGKKGADSMLALASILGDSQKILDGISDGGVRGADALQMILSKLAAIDDPIEKQTMGIAIMGTQYEDLGQKVTGALSTINSEFDSSKATMDEIASVKYDNLATDFRKLGRELLDDFIIPLGEDAMPVLRDFTAWISENKELIKNLTMMFGGAVLAKGAVNASKSLVTTSKAAMQAATGIGNASKAAKAFSIASGLLGGPVGIATTAIAGLGAMVVSYKHHQEQARHELLNMGDSIKEAYGNYKSVQEHTSQVNSLITEYDELQRVVKNAATPTDELEAARARLLEIEQQLIDLNPDILKAEDAKSGKFREQLGLVEKMNEIESERAKRELEVNFINNQDKIDDLESEFSKLTGNVAKFEEAYNAARESYVQYRDFVNQRDAILDDPTLDYAEQSLQIESLIAKVNELTGENYRVFADIDFAFADFEEAFNSNYESLVQAQEDLDAVNNSFEQIYEVAKAYIESDLGGTIEEQAAKFNEMSEAQQQAFIKALEDVAALNRDLDLLPAEKKINVQVIYDEARGLQYAPSHIKQSIVPDYRQFDQYADGGFANKASIFGEAGLEAAIPINNKPRSHAILDEVNRMMGHDSGGSDISNSFVFAPKVTIQGGTGKEANQVTTALEHMRPQFERWFKEMVANERRLVFK
ncbi:phage tail tape measure protein [Paenibacillus camelliae]|uniref:phage tail tape measure protein n=1 Tax=Paenibacillus camelliae TaxID=512410 RepID=UPI00203BA437|nr:phage tail tape measure protein [Paenibacillus camelliae]MCM3632931.1 phage tail tape measure protein [Paenibacillus camelliae]